LLREILDVSQDDPSILRRWFHDDYFDLFVLQAGNELDAFELCYGIDANEQALVWSRARGFFHDGGKVGSADFIGARLEPGAPIQADPIIARFEQAAEGLPAALREALTGRLREYAQDADGSARRESFRRAAWQTRQKSRSGRGRSA
jgi:hypothetical protein